MKKITNKESLDMINEVVDECYDRGYDNSVVREFRIVTEEGDELGTILDLWNCMVADFNVCGIESFRLNSKINGKPMYGNYMDILYSQRVVVIG